MIIGITGRVGSGKSEAVKILQTKFQFELIDLDIIGHQLLTNQAIQQKLVSTFGTADRQQLSTIVFNSPEKLQKLNQITHPEIHKIVVDTIKTSKEKHKIITGALLEEINLTKLCDKIILIWASDQDSQKMLDEKFTKISKFQRNYKEYTKTANKIIHNSYTPQFAADCLATFKEYLNQTNAEIT
jgi:dephospho-CoA kinase